MKQSPRLGKEPCAYSHNNLNDRLFDIIGVGYSKLA